MEAKPESRRMPRDVRADAKHYEDLAEDSEITKEDSGAGLVVQALASLLAASADMLGRMDEIIALLKPESEQFNLTSGGNGLSFDHGDRMMLAAVSAVGALMSGHGVVFWVGSEESAKSAATCLRDVCEALGMADWSVDHNGYRGKHLKFKIPDLGDVYHVSPGCRFDFDVAPWVSAGSDRLGVETEPYDGEKTA